MHLGQLILILMVTAIACDLFDRWFKRTAVRLDGRNHSVELPDRWISWGVITDVTIDPMIRSDLRFFRLKLPIRTYGLVPDGSYRFNYALRSHTLMWIDGSHLMPTNPMLGWSITPGLE